jgi:nitrate reductase (cytochrome), electron transfer subunit
MNAIAKIIVVAGSLAACGFVAFADELPEGLRGPTPLNEEPKAPRLANVENKDVKRGRAYTSQPPTIPHSIERYEITRNVNFCMYCHSRLRNEEFGAPMVSATHYMDREHDYLAEISPRRYFCTQCHVTQVEVSVPVDNTFEDVYDIVMREQANARSQKTGEKKPEKIDEITP